MFSSCVLTKLKGYNNSKGLSLEACFTPDSQFVMIGERDYSDFMFSFISLRCVLEKSCCAGSEDGRVHVWSTESGMKVAVLDGKHPGPISSLQFNPRYMTFVSACTSTVSSLIICISFAPA